MLFERENATLEQIEEIDWERPEVKAIAPTAGKNVLPEGYGFEVERIDYESGTKSYRVRLKVARQYLGDVTGYQEEIEELQATVTENAATIQEQAATIEAQAATITEQAAAITELQAATADGSTESQDAAEEAR